jgi:hypothetical protein
MGGLVDNYVWPVDNYGWTVDNYVWPVDNYGWTVDNYPAMLKWSVVGTYLGRNRK